MLWRLTLLIVTPDSCTGSRLATGVMMPLRPTCRSILRICVLICCAGNLYAIARRGWCWVVPSMWRFESSFILITSPSKSLSCVSKNCCVLGSRQVSIISCIDPYFLYRSKIGSQRFLRFCNISSWVVYLNSSCHTRS